MFLERTLENLLPWEPSVTVMTACGMSAFCYLRGCKRVATSGWRKLSFWAGLFLLYCFSQTQFDYYSEHAFFMHRIQHAVLHHEGPFLIALSRPGAALAAGAPGWLRLYAGRLLQSGLVQLVAALLNRPLAALLLFSGSIFLWLLPNVHFIAMLDRRWYHAMTITVIAGGLLFWNLVFNNYSLRPAALSPAVRILLVLGVIPPQIAMGAALSFSGHDLYPVYAICGRIFSGVSPLADQQLGGIILWVTGAMMSILGALIILRREWLK